MSDLTKEEMDVLLQAHMVSTEVIPCPDCEAKDKRISELEAERDHYKHAAVKLTERISELEITLKLIQTEIDRWTGAKRYGEVFADQIRHIIKEQEDDSA